MKQQHTVSRVSAWLGRAGIALVQDEGSVEYKELEQSDVVVADARVAPEGGASLGFPSSAEEGRQRVFVKLVSVPTLRARIAKPDEKWRISARSFANEFGFYATAPIASMIRSGVHVPRPLLVERLSGDEVDALDHEYAFALEYLDPKDYRQESELDEADARRALAFLARFHAFFARLPTDTFVTLSRRLFQHGGWWRKALRPSVRFDRIPEVFASLIANFESFNDLDTPDNHECMRWLAEHVDWIEERLTLADEDRDGEIGLRTVVHGDFKTSNVFFKRDSSIDADQNNVAAIDFQWVGPARTGAADVVYLLVGGVRWEVLQQSEAALLDHYLDELSRCLTLKREDDDSSSTPTPTLDRDAWLAEYRLEFLCYTKTALPQLLLGLDDAACARNYHQYGWLTHEYDPRMTRWLCQKTVHYVSLLQHAGKGQ